jgi:hypothetical protein
MLGNWFAVAALLSWPAVAAVLYRATPIAFATVWSILGAYLLLPSEVTIKFPMIPALDKSSIPNICAAIGCVLLAPRQKRLQARSRVVGFFILLYVIGPVLTSVLNNDAIVAGGRVLPGVGSYDGISALLSQSIYFLPFMIGRRIFRSAIDIETMIRALVVAGLLYSVPMIFELRMSPQLANWIYGYIPESMNTVFRFGGYRPVVFLNNGLVLSFFAVTSFLASIALWRAKLRIGSLPPSGVAAYLAVIVILCKSGGALVYGIVAGFLVALTSPRLQTKIAVVLVSIGLLYPILRANDIFPTKTLVNIAELVNDERAQSLRFRFENEDRLLARASQRFWFGWGRYGRNRVYEEGTGRDIGTTDGAWIITLGTFGIVGFLAQFGLLSLPVLRAASVIKRSDSKYDNLLLATLALVVALTVVEQLPNASLSPWSWLLAGALLGRTELLASTALVSLRSGADLKNAWKRPKS